MLHQTRCYQLVLQQPKVVQARYDILCVCVCVCTSVHRVSIACVRQCAGALVQTCIIFPFSKRPLPTNDTTTSPAPKRKVSPIRFSSATSVAKKTPATSTGKRQPWSVYEPPKGSYSNKLDTSGLSDSNWRGGWGRGRRNRRGGGRGRGTWRTGGKWT